MADGWRRRRPMPYRPAWLSPRLQADAETKRARRRARNLRWLASGGVLPR